MGEAVLKLSNERAYWFVVRGESLVGPLLPTQVLEQLRNSEVGPLDFCWKDGFSEWRPLASVSEFSEECSGKKFSPVAFPKLGVPNQKSTDTSRRRRASDSMTLLSLAPENRKVVQVNFAKTRVRRLSLYEWAFAMMFAIVCTFVGSKLTVDSILARMESLRQQRHIAGRFQNLGGVEQEDRYVLADYAATPLLSAPAWGQIDYQVQLGQQGALVRPTMTFVGFLAGESLGTPTWPVDQKFRANVWNPVARDLDAVYHRPVQTTALVPEAKSSSVTLVLRGEPYLY